MRSTAPGGTTVTRSFNDAGTLLGESYSGGPLDGVTVSNRFDALLRRTNVTVRVGGVAVVTNDYAFDLASGRLDTVSLPGHSAIYSYLADSALVEQIEFRQDSATRMTTSKSYDFANRLTAIESLDAQLSTITSFSYSYNPANQRTLRREGDESYWRYEYDSLGQVRSGKKYWSDGTLVAGQQFEYSFDDIGNRTQAKAGGDENGANLRTNVYSANLVNQYTNRTVPGLVEVMGLALGTNTVTVDGQAPYRRGEYFRKEVAVTNTSAPVWRSVVVASPGETSVTRHEFVPRTPENFGYDLDGNLTNDGRWVYTWDAENRLARMVSATTVGPQQRLDFVYDWQGRRIAKTVWDNTAGTGSPATDLKFLYDGWNLIAELNATNNATIRSYGWGLDLSGSMQGAGGVGGLLSVTVHAGPEAGSYFCAYDGNGNVISLINATNGTIAAQYEYGPFGELLRASGPMAIANAFRFSTKYQDDETGLVYYGYRYYNAGTGRWLSRDLLGEQGGPNLYGFVQNSPTWLSDALGLFVTVENPLAASPPQLVEGLAHDLIAHYFNGGGTLFNFTGGDELKGNQGVKDGVKEPIYGLARRLCRAAHPGGSIGQEALHIRNVVPSGWWLVQTLNMPNPDLEINTPYALFKQDCSCTVAFTYTATWHDIADLHATRDGRLLFPDFILIGLQYVGLGQNYPIEINWSASGIIDVSTRDNGRDRVRGYGWPFD